MPLIVEDGTGSNSLANAYTDSAFVDALIVARGFTLPASIDGLILQAMDATESLQYRGEPTSALQPLSWPRTGVVLDDGTQIADNAIPLKLQTAMAWLVYYINAGFDLSAPPEQQIIRERIEGAIEVEYFRDRQNVQSQTTIEDLPNAFNCLQPFLLNSGTDGDDCDGIIFRA